MYKCSQLSVICIRRSHINIFDSLHRLPDSESQCVFVVKMAGCSKNPAVSSWEEMQLERLTPDTAAVQIVE